MKTQRKTAWLLLLATLVLAGCGAKVPSLRISQPWIRSLWGTEEIRHNSKLKIGVECQASPLLGDERLVNATIKEKAIYLLERRGFASVEVDADYHVKLLYSIKRRDLLQASTQTTTYGYQNLSFSTGSGAGATSGLGVAIARTVGSLLTRDITRTSQELSQQTSYTTTISVEFLGPTGEALWKGESTWDTDRLDITRHLTTPLQLIFSDLPNDPSHLPSVYEVKESHADNYYKNWCYDRWFSCPALPYAIVFEELSTYPYEYDIKCPSDIGDTDALAAYVDLLETAEYALPAGSKDWSDPTDRDLWTKAVLGQRYLLGPNQRPVNVIVRLTGKTEGYFVEKAWVAADEEFGNFRTDFENWKKALHEYFDVYKQ